MPAVPDVNSMLRTGENTLQANETENTGNALTLDLGVGGTPLNGLWWAIENPTLVAGTTPGYTITLRYSNDKSSWSNGPSQVVVAKGEYLTQINTAFRYVSYNTARGNADNTAVALTMFLTDAVSILR